MAKPAFDPSKPSEEVKPPFDPNLPSELVAEDEGPSMAEQLETAARSGLESASLGLTEPAISGVNAVLGNLIDAGFDAEDLKDFFSKSIDSARIGKAYEQDVMRRKQLEEAAPEAAIAGTVVGAFAPVGPAAALGRLAKGAVGATKLGQATGAIGKIGATAAESALAAGGVTAAEQAVADVTGFPSGSEGLSPLEAAAFGGKVGGGLAATGAALKAGAALAPKIGSVLGGPRVEAIKEYLADPQAVQRAKSPAQIKELMDQTVERLKADVADGQLGIAEAKEALQKAEQQLRDVSQAKKADISDAVREARANFRQAEQELLEPIKKAKPPTALQSDVIDAAERLKEQVTKESEKSYAILENLEKQAQTGKINRVNLSTVPDYIQNIQNDLKVDGKLLSAEERAAFNVLEQYRTENSAIFKDQVSYPKVKRIIQSIDRDIRKFSAPNSADFSDLTRSKLLELRRGLDNLIKESPEYAEQMLKVSAATELLGDVSKFLGKDQRIAGKLEGIWRPNQAQDQELLGRLGQAVGVDLITPIQQYAQTKALAQQPLKLQAMAEALPEAAALKKAQSRMDLLKRPGAVEFLAPKQAAAVQRAEIGVQRAMRVADEAKKVVRELGPLAKEYSNINAIRAAVLDKNPEIMEGFKLLSTMSGQDFVQMIDDLRLAESFSKDFTQGSRNVNMFSIMSGAAAAAATGSLEAGLILGGAGAGLGKFMDKFGGQVTQKVLDKYLQIKGMPSVQKLQASLNSFPKPVRDYTISEFVRSIQQIKNETVEIDPANIAQVYDDLKTADLDSVTKARAMSQLMTKGSVESDDLKRAMLGTKPIKVEAKPASRDTLEMDKPDVLRAMANK